MVADNTLRVGKRRARGVHRGLCRNAFITMPFCKGALDDAHRSECRGTDDAVHPSATQLQYDPRKDIQPVVQLVFGMRHVGMEMLKMMTGTQRVKKLDIAGLKR